MIMQTICMLLHRTSTFFHYMANVSFEDFQSQMKKISNHNTGMKNKEPIYLVENNYVMKIKIFHRNIPMKLLTKKPFEDHGFKKNCVEKTMG